MQSPQKPNWRKSYQLMVDEHIKQLREWRIERCDYSIELPTGRVRLYKNLTDDDILACSYRLAEQDVNRAIHEHNAATEYRSK